MRNKGMFTSGQNFLELKEEQVLLRIGAVMELKIPLFSVSPNREKKFQMEAFVPCILEIYLSYVGPYT